MGLIKLILPKRKLIFLIHCFVCEKVTSPEPSGVDFECLVLCDKPQSDSSSFLLHPEGCNLHRKSPWRTHEKSREASRSEAESPERRSHSSAQLGAHPIGSTPSSPWHLIGHLLRPQVSRPNRRQEPTFTCHHGDFWYLYDIFTCQKCTVDFWKLVFFLNFGCRILKLWLVNKWMVDIWKVSQLVHCTSTNPYKHFTTTQRVSS